MSALKHRIKLEKLLYLLLVISFGSKIEAFVEGEEQRELPNCHRHMQRGRTFEIDHRYVPVDDRRHFRMSNIRNQVGRETLFNNRRIVDSDSIMSNAYDRRDFALHDRRTPLVDRRTDAQFNRRVIDRQSRITTLRIDPDVRIDRMERNIRLGSPGSNERRDQRIVERRLNDQRTDRQSRTSRDRIDRHPQETRTDSRAYVENRSVERQSGIDQRIDTQRRNVEYRIEDRQSTPSNERRDRNVRERRELRTNSVDRRVDHRRTGQDRHDRQLTAARVDRDQQDRRFETRSRSLDRRGNVDRGDVRRVDNNNQRVDNRQRNDRRILDNRNNRMDSSRNNENRQESRSERQQSRVDRQETSQRRLSIETESRTRSSRIEANSRIESQTRREPRQQQERRINPESRRVDRQPSTIRDDRRVDFERSNDADVDINNNVRYSTTERFNNLQSLPLSTKHSFSANYWPNAISLALGLLLMVQMIKNSGETKNLSRLLHFPRMIKDKVY